MLTRVYLRSLSLLSLLVLLSNDVHSQNTLPEKIQFTRLTTAQGLSQSTINAIAKDKAGFMWFGTADGLNRYDGYRFKTYKNIPGDSSSIPYNSIKVLYVDTKGVLWIGPLGGGLVSYDEKTDSFHRYAKGVIQSIYEDRSGVLWIGKLEGLFRLDRKTGKVIPAEYYNSKFSLLKRLIVTKIFEDNKNNFWIGTSKGLYLTNRNSNTITSFFSQGKSGALTNDEITSLVQDRSGRFWIGSKGGLDLYNYDNSSFSPAQSRLSSEGKTVRGVVNALYCDEGNAIWVGTEYGLGLYKPDKSSYAIIRTDAYDTQSLSQNSIHSLYLDQQILWVGTALGGVNKYDKNQSFVSRYKIYNPNDQKANTNVVTSFAENSPKSMWIGTDGGGLFIWDSYANTFEPFVNDKKATSTLGSSILCLRKSKNEESLWIGTYSNGLFQLNLKTRRLKQYNVHNKFLNNNAVYAILEDKNSNIWAGTNGGGVSVINPDNQTVKTLVLNQQNGLTNNHIRALMEDNKGKIWIGTYGGINIFDPASNKLVPPAPQAAALGQHLIRALFEDSNNRIWVGTQVAGVFIYDENKKELVNLTEKKGLSNNRISSITEDAKGFIWISTSSGLNRVSMLNNTITNLLIDDGLQTNEFIAGAGYTWTNGSVLFGSVDGFNLLSSPSYHKNVFIPPVVITDFQLPANSPVSHSDKPAKLSVNDRDPISLSYDQSVFTIEFAALNYSSTAKNKYACMLEGLDKDWHYIGYERKVTYTNLAPGKYLFRVKASNNDGIWNNTGTSLRIIVHPPFWRTDWAYLLYTLILSFVLYSIYKEAKARQKLKTELLFQKLTSEKMKELNQLKMNFFTNVSHELRTPLSLIIDPLRKITEEDVSLNQIKSLSALAFKNASRLLSLVNQLLDFRKFEGSLKLELTTVNITHFVRELALAFRERATKRNMEFTVAFDNDILAATVDPDKFQKILTNLISNAFKFTPDGGKISLSTFTYRDDSGKRQLEIHLKDTGPGIPETYKTKIFDIFFQIKNTPRFGMESSGIGLALVRELVQLHGGEISEKGKEGEGAHFVLKMPAGEASTVNSDPPLFKEETEINPFKFNESIIPLNNIQNRSEITILLVEDNDELRRYIAGYLSIYYQVEEASNGQEGYLKAISLIPDLIISDVMMKDGDGLELCERVKTDEKTSHIPVILLTAKQADDSKIQGYKSGADAYIPKPFNSNLLETRVSNLIESRKKLRALFAEGKDVDSEIQHKLSGIDQQFLQKAGQIVLENLLEPTFDVEEFSRLLKMNRRQLARKLKAITDQTPQEYLIQIRLKTAIELILNENLNISQAAYRVGFSEPANFSRSFSKVYGKSPKHYLKEKYGKLLVSPTS